MSIWSGSSSDSWVDSDRLAKYRRLLKAERKAEFRKVSPDQFYTISVDVGRYDANTVACVFKVTPQDLWFKKSLVNIEQTQVVPNPLASICSSEYFNILIFTSSIISFNQITASSLVPILDNSANLLPS